MKPGERVDLIRESAQTLAGQGWGDINLVLGQFGFPTDEHWQGDEYPYLVEQLRYGTDDALIELDAYLHPGEVPATEPQREVVDDPDSPWETGDFHLFITHLASEKGNVGKLKTALSEHSIEAFVAHEAIEPTRQWQDVIESALRTCDALAVWLTPGLRESNWCDQEIGFAVGRRVLIVPLRFGLDPYGFIGKYQAVTVRREHPFDELSRTIFDLIVAHDLSQRAMAQALVSRYESSTDWETIRPSVGYLRRIPADAWSPALKDQARTAYQRNPKITTTWVGSRMADDVVTDLLDSLP